MVIVFNRSKFKKEDVMSMTSTELKRVVKQSKYVSTYTEQMFAQFYNDNPSTFKGCYIRIEGIRINEDYPTFCFD